MSTLGTNVDLVAQKAPMSVSWCQTQTIVVCKKRREKSLPWRKDMTLTASLRRRDEARDGGSREDIRRGEARERAGAADSVHRQSCA